MLARNTQYVRPWQTRQCRPVMKPPAKINLDQLIDLASKKKLDPEAVEWLQQKINQEVVFPPRPVTLEAIDRLIQMASDEIGYNGGTHAEEICAYIFGQGENSGVLIDILTLARIALVHLRGASFLVHEPKPCEPPTPGNPTD
jgi:hypothetical protein